MTKARPGDPGVELVELEERLAKIEELLRSMQQRDDNQDGHIHVRLTGGSYA